MKGACENCRYWQKTEDEDSGLALTKGVNWIYIGKCLHPNTLHPEPPSFGSCHFWKKKIAKEEAK